MLTKYHDTMLTKTRDLFDPFHILDELNLTPFYEKSITSSAYRVNTTENGLELQLDLPGLKSKDLTVQTVDRLIKVSGKIRGEEFKYSYRISKDYNAEEVDATLEDGVLFLKFQKHKQTAAKTVDVKVK